jgi:hypothetical protein
MNGDRKPFRMNNSGFSYWLANFQVNWPMSFPKQIFLLFFFISGSTQIFGASFPVLPEVQVYHTVGSRGTLCLICRDIDE